MTSALLVLSTFFALACHFSTGEEGARSVASPTISNYTTCTKGDFGDGHQCTSTCTATTTGLYEWHWIYYANDPSENVTIYEGVTRTDDPDENSTEIALTMSNYSAGVYRCWYHYLDPEEIVLMDFRVDPTQNGILLNESCVNSTQCLSLDATCDDGSCQCIDPYRYPMDAGTEMVACLKGVGPFEPCNADEQCIDAGDNYNCTDDTCKCMARYTYVAEVNRYLCLQPVDQGQPCRYQEECTLVDLQSWCYVGVCDCRDDYSFNATLHRCVNVTDSDVVPPSDDGLSFGAVVGIIVGSAAAVVVLFAFVVALFVCLRSR